MVYNYKEVKNNLKIKSKGFDYYENGFKCLQLFR